MTPLFARGGIKRGRSQLVSWSFRGGCFCASLVSDRAWSSRRMCPLAPCARTLVGCSECMKVMFTPKEFTRLLELVHLGMRMVEGRQGGEALQVQRYAELEQKLYELATPLGCADLVDVGGTGQLVPSEKLRDDERLAKIAGDYDNDTFWHELVTRLADRDLATEQTRQSVLGTGGPSIDADARLHKLEDAYWDEFEKNDLANVIILRGGRG